MLENKNPPFRGALKRAMGFEPTTSSLARRRSTTELHPHVSGGYFVSAALEALYVVVGWHLSGSGRRVYKVR